jgi:hypothetical protein
VAGLTGAAPVWLHNGVVGSGTVPWANTVDFLEVSTIGARTVPAPAAALIFSIVLLVISEPEIPEARLAFFPFSFFLGIQSPFILSREVMSANLLCVS